MAEKSQRAAPIGEPYKKKCGKITFIVSAFGNPNTTKTADELILQMLETQSNNFQKRSA